MVSGFEVRQAWWFGWLGCLAGCLELNLDLDPPVWTCSMSVIGLSNQPNMAGSLAELFLCLVGFQKSFMSVF